MEFDIWKRYEFRPELSDGLTGDEIVTTIHPGNHYHLQHMNRLHLKIQANFARNNHMVKRNY